MADFYEPNLLFRNNAIKRSSVTSKSEDKSGSEYKSSSSSYSWLLNLYNSNDTQVLDQSCSLNRLNIKSSYWKIPDDKFNLTSLAVSGSSLSRMDLAVSSANASSNLYIYDLDAKDNFLTHHSTISLPHIHSMRWMSGVNSSEKFLLTGNSKGYVNLVSIPSIEEPEQSAEIVKRFNHRKHLKKDTKALGLYQGSTNIHRVGYSNASHLMVTLYDSNLFAWDMNDTCSLQKPKPTSIMSIPGVSSFDIHSNNSNTIGICGKFGVSLLDIRESKITVPTSANMKVNPKIADSNIIKWSPTDDYIFASAHSDGVVRVWDVRMQNYTTSLSSHNGRVVSVEWNGKDIFTGGRDGNIIHWDLTTDANPVIDEPLVCKLKEGLNSINFDSSRNQLEKTLNERKCGTILPASNSNIVDMVSLKEEGSTEDSDVRLLSIDSSSFLGVHFKIYEASDKDLQERLKYYSSQDLETMKTSFIDTSNSSSTLVDRELSATSKLPNDIPSLIESSKSEVAPTEDLLIDLESSNEDSKHDYFILKEDPFAHQNTSFISINSSAKSPLDSPIRSCSTFASDSLDTISTVPTVIDALEDHLLSIKHKHHASDIGSFFDLGCDISHLYMEPLEASLFDFK